MNNTKQKILSFDRIFVLAGVVGLEPTKCRSQSPVPYHLATPQYSFVGYGIRSHTRKSNFPRRCCTQSLLNTGVPAAHHNTPLNAAWFPTSHGSRGTIAQDPHLSTDIHAAFLRTKNLNPGISPCCSGLQVQGSAKSPISVTLFRIRSVSIPYIFVKIKYRF